MASNAATEAALGELHSKVAKVMTGALETIDIAQEVYKHQAEQVFADPESIIPIEKPPGVSPALLGAITKFLSDNSITCAPGESKELSELESTLERKRRKRTVGNVIHLELDDE